MTLVTLVLAFSVGQVKDVAVASPTRLDWAFTVRGFGKDASQIPASYSSTNQKYQFYAPKSDGKPRPLVVFISPSNQPAGWSAWKEVCEKDGVVFCSPYNAGNNVAAGQRARIVLDVVDDVRRKHRIDPHQTYLSGFSGGGRMACAIGFSLPEVFAGVVPVCGTNPITEPTYLRHRLEDRVSIAFVTGEKDFNRKENEVYMAPWFAELGIRSKLWIAPNVAHAIPGPAVMSDVYAWLQADLPRRQAEAKKRPELALGPDDAPDSAEQAKRLVAAAGNEFKEKSRIWHGVALLQGATGRFPTTPDSRVAAAFLKKLLTDERLIEAIAEQGGADEQKAISAQAKALERFGDLARAVQAWGLLVRNYEGTSVGDNAQKQIDRIRRMKE